MISRKGKRKLEHNGTIFYYFIRKNKLGIPKIHIVSEDKKIQLELHLFHTETGTTKEELEKVLKAFLSNQ